MMSITFRNSQMDKAISYRLVFRSLESDGILTLLFILDLCC